MEYRPFGNSGLKTSVIGFGGWPMGRGQYGAFDEQEVTAAVHRALDLGVNLFDTAARYGVGYGEELLGKALGDRRNEVILVTKGGTRWDEERNELVRDSSERFLRECIEGSLKRLGTDHVDVFLIHWPDTSLPFDVPMDTFRKLRDEGKIRYGGVSNFTVDQMFTCLAHFPIVCNQIGYHLFDRRVEGDVMPFCQANGLAVMAYGSLAHGLLTGTMTPETRFGEDDWRRRGYAFGLPLFHGDDFRRNLAIVEKLKHVSSQHRKTVAQLALAWVLSNPAVSVALTGIRTPGEIEENAAAANWQLTESERRDIEGLFEGNWK